MPSTIEDQLTEVYAVIARLKALEEDLRSAIDNVLMTIRGENDE